MKTSLLYCAHFLIPVYRKQIHVLTWDLHKASSFCGSRT